MGDATHPVMPPQAADSPARGVTENLQERLSGAVHAAESAACGAAAAVKDTAQSVAQAVDVRDFVQEHPWLAVGGSIALGFLASELLRAGARPASGGSWAGSLYQPSPGSGGEPGRTPEAAAAGEPLGKMASWLGEQFDEFKSFAAGSIMNYVHSLVARGLESMEEGLRAQGGSDQSRDPQRPQQQNQPAQEAHP